MKHDPRPHGMPWMLPYLTVKDAGKTAEFYRDVLGFEIINQAANDKGRIEHAELRYQDMVIMCGNEGAYGSQVKSPLSGNFMAPFTLYMYCDDVKAQFEKLIQNRDIKITSQLQAAFWGDLMFSFTDPDGYAWCLATYMGNHGCCGDDHQHEKACGSGACDSTDCHADAMPKAGCGTTGHCH